MKLTVAKYYTPSGRCIQRLDYSHRDERSGEVKAVSDSLIRTFKTKAGRQVQDGRGIHPDKEVEKEDVSHILNGLVSNWVIFDYATLFKQSHSSIDSADKFHLTDKEYEAFVDYARKAEFTYDTNTEELFDRLKKTAEEEKYFSGAEKEFEALKLRISPDKSNDLIKFRKQIQEFLENEIVSRYYYQTGRIKHELPLDEDVRMTLQVFETNCSDLLKAPK
jgi:carboxyl-terminal processing protease